jgi:hypothetical protein
MSNTTFQWVPLSTGDILAPDGSGATALVTVQGRKFSCDILGSVKVRPVSDRNDSGRSPPKWMSAYVEKTYRTELAKLATPAWMEMNRAMYADVAS